MLVAHAVHPQPAQALEGFEGGVGRASEDPDGVSDGTQVEGGEPSLDVGDRVTLVAETQGTPLAQRYALSSWTSWPFGFAPMRRTLGSPSLNKMSVGMLMTP